MDNRAKVELDLDFVPIQFHLLSPVVLTVTSRIILHFSHLLQSLCQYIQHLHNM